MCAQLAAAQEWEDVEKPFSPSHIWSGGKGKGWVLKVGGKKGYP
jgi:hypothetical protein